MSFMYVKGKIYHCLNCKKSIKVQYMPILINDTPTHLTQIGDDNIIFWYKLNEKYGQPPEEEDVSPESPVFLHDEGFCKGCVENIIRKNKKLIELQNKYNRFADIYKKASELLDSYSKEINPLISDLLDSFVNNMVFYDLKEIDDEIFSQTLREKDFLTKRKKRALLHEFFKKVENKIPEYMKKIVLRNENVRYFISQYEQYSKELLEELYELSSTITGEVYIRKDIYSPENLNNYIITDMTVRIPINPKQDIEYFFYPANITEQDLKYCISNLHSDALLSFDVLGFTTKLKRKTYNLANV